jgi:hypothetical protein
MQAVYDLLRTLAANAIPANSGDLVFDAVETTAQPKTPLVAITTEMSDPRQMSIGGNPRYQIDGNIVITLYASSGAGDGDQLAKATAICDALRRATAIRGTTSIRVQVPGIVNGVRSGASWTRVVRAPFKATFYDS